MCQHKNEYFISNLKHVVVCQYKKCCCLSRNVEKTFALIKGSSTKKVYENIISILL
jgi:hypothetical protein